MNHNKIIPILLITASGFLTSTCSDYLELKPKDNLVQQEFWQNKEQVESAIAACYASMNQQAFMDRVFQWGELRAEMIVSVKAGSAQQNMLKGFLNSSNTLVNWATFYKTINYCNTVLNFARDAQALDQSFSIEELYRFESEALAIRALVYFILVRNFKEVPLVIEATLNDQSNFYPFKSSEQEVIAQIITDLKESVEHLPLTNYQSDFYDRGRFTRGAALAVLADVYLWSYHYDECIEVCEEIMTLNKYSLVDGVDWFEQIFFQGNSIEGIFELQFSDIFSTLKNFFYVSSPVFKSFGGMNDLYGRGGIEDNRGDKATYSSTNGAVFKYAGVDSKTETFRSSQQFYNNWIFYRYADVLLMLAEAYIYSPSQQNLERAYELINEIHMRATGNQLETSRNIVDLGNALLLERQKEFAFEAKRWYDLLRFARRNNFENQRLILEMAELKTSSDNYEEIMSYYADTTSYFLPVYQNEINLNPNLDQNPYYDNN